MSFELDSSTYEPGVCNIGPKEQRRRLLSGIMGFAVAIIGFILIIALGLPLWYRLLLFFPLFGGFVGIYQYTMKFCVAFAAMAKYHMT